MQTVQMARNPQMAINQMAQNNPQMKQAIDYVNANGGNAKDAFYKLAQEKGVDPNSILNQLRSLQLHKNFKKGENLWTQELPP